MPTLTAVGLCAPMPASLPHPVCLRMSAMLGPETFRRKRITVSSGAGYAMAAEPVPSCSLSRSYSPYCVAKPEPRAREFCRPNSPDYRHRKSMTQ